MSNFAIIGAAGFIAPRHMKAIAETGNRLVAISDPHDAVGVVDQYFPEAKYFREIERFDRYLEKLRRNSPEQRVEYVSICTPNYLHDAHARLALRVRAHAICEKPLVVNPWNLEGLADIEQETGCRVYNVLQLRLHPSVAALKKKLDQQPRRERIDICLTYVTRRGAWYPVSWKGEEEKSGGLIANIGVHFYDMLMWLFGPVERSTIHVRSRERVSGFLELEWARVHWLLSVDGEDLPREYREKGKHAYRSLTLDGEEFEFSEGFTDLHTEVYREILAGRGFGIADARPSVDLVHRLRHMDLVTPARGEAHPMISNR